MASVELRDSKQELQLFDRQCLIAVMYFTSMSGPYVLEKLLIPVAWTWFLQFTQGSYSCTVMSFSQVCRTLDLG